MLLEIFISINIYKVKKEARANERIFGNEWNKVKLFLKVINSRE